MATSITAVQRQLTPLEKAWSDFVEKIGIAGWREAFGERIIWIRRVFQLSLLAVSAVCFFNIFLSVRQATSGTYKNEYTDFFDQPSLPFSNVTICAQVYFNETFIRQNLTIPPNAREHMRRNKKNLEDFYRELTLYLSLIIRARSFTNKDTILFDMITRANPQTWDYSEFIKGATAPCESMLRRCWFNGREFDCCSRAIQSIDDDGICYQLMLNFDSDNAFPDARTFQQTSPGPEEGLIVEASLPTRDFPWLDTDAQNGYKIFVDPTLVTLFASPVNAPHAAETFVRVVPTLNRLAKHCVPHGKLSGFQLGNLYFDPYGYNLGASSMVGTVRKYLNCEMIGYSNRPNRSVVCPPKVSYLVSQFMTSYQLNDRIIGAVVDMKIMTSSKLFEIYRSLEQLFKSSTYTASHSLTHCQYWTYSSSASFHSLRPPNAAADKQQMYSKIHIFYGDLDYRQVEQVKEISAYLAFCNVGNVLVLFWGMSVAGFFDLLFYVPRYIYFWTKSIRNRRRAVRRRGAVRVRNVRVHPI